MARFAIPSDKAIGVSVGDIRKLAKQIGPNHTLAQALWATDRYEARLLATFIDEPARVSAAQMDRWCKDFDSWALCDTACFALFDRTPHAWRKVAPWAARRPEFEKRAGFALLWALAVHDKACGDAAFLQALPLIEAAADDERNFVKKAVNMALRAMGKRNAALHAATVAMARRLAGSQDATARWIGKDALRELTSAQVTRRLA
jgi:3-methyladenine DNA glycosylase AlkD